jgi:predicted N-acyltransferase
MKKNIIQKEERIFSREWKNILFNLVFATLTVIFPILFYKNIVLTAILVLIVTIAGLIKWKSKLTTAIFIFGAVWGPVSEMICVHFGVWQYSQINFYNIPLWLFIVWGNAAAFIYQTALEFRKIGIKK